MEKTVLSFPSLKNPSRADMRRILDVLARNGLVHIKQVEDPADHVEALTQLAHPFGNAIFHKLSDEHGIHPIRYIPGYPEYANANTEDLGLHTDGSFEENPPAFMLMYCERASSVGGHSRMASGELLYRHLQEQHPQYLHALFLPDAFTITRDDRHAKRAVFSRKDDRIRIAFRSGSDVRMTIRTEAVEAFEYVREWLADPANFVDFLLAPGDVMIFDNTRVLHGRTAFPRDGQRSLYGLWCDGNSDHRSAMRAGFDPTGLEEAVMK